MKTIEINGGIYVKGQKAEVCKRCQHRVGGIMIGSEKLIEKTG